MTSFSLQFALVDTRLGSSQMFIIAPAHASASQHTHTLFWPQCLAQAMPAVLPSMVGFCLACACRQLMPAGQVVSSGLARHVQLRAVAEQCKCHASVLGACLVHRPGPVAAPLLRRQVHTQARHQHKVPDPVPRAQGMPAGPPLLHGRRARALASSSLNHPQDSQPCRMNQVKRKGKNIVRSRFSVGPTRPNTVPCLNMHQKHAITTEESG